MLTVWLEEELDSSSRFAALFGERFPAFCVMELSLYEMALYPA